MTLPKILHTGPTPDPLFTLVKNDLLSKNMFQLAWFNTHFPWCNTEEVVLTSMMTSASLFQFLNKLPQLLVVVQSTAHVLWNHDLILDWRDSENKGCKGHTAQHLQFTKCPCAVTNDLHVTVLYTVFWPLVLASSTRRISCSSLRGDLLTTLCTVRRRVDHASLWNTMITVVVGRLLKSIVLFWHLHTPYRELCHFPCSEVTDLIAVWLNLLTARRSAAWRTGRMCD